MEYLPAKWPCMHCGALGALVVVQVWEHALLAPADVAGMSEGEDLVLCRCCGGYQVAYGLAPTRERAS